MSLSYHQYKGWMVKAPSTFLLATPDEISKVCNGMGPKGSGWLVPDTMYGLNLSAAGDVHDWMYAYPETFNRKECDDVFHENMQEIIKQHGGFGLLQWLRNRRALKYYLAVRVGGAKHFGGACE